MRGFGADPPRGVPALRDLLSAIRQHSADEDGCSDEGFIEGAGAFLGLVLAERFGAVRHVSDGSHHGLQLGQHGFFDPFACVARTLDATHQADTLLSGVAEAEDEAFTRSHCSQVLAALSTSLQDRGSPLRIERRVGHRIWLRSEHEALEVDLDRLLTVTSGEGAEEVQQAVDHFARALDGGPARAQEPYALARKRLLPRLIGPAFRARLASRGQQPALVEQPWHGPLAIALVLQYEGRARYALQSDLVGWGVSAQTAQQAAMQNLASRPVRVERSGSGPNTLLRVRTGDGYDATRILLPEVQDLLVEQLRCPLRVALPHRDALIACSGDAPGVEAELRAQAVEEAQRAPHAVSDSLWTCDESGHWIALAI